MNKLADSLATQHLSHPPALFVPRKLPGFKVRLLYDKSVITSKFYRTLANIKYDLELKTYILRKINWPPPTFDKIDWPAHQKAFNYLTKYQQISVAKLIHNLVNTNRQIFCITRLQLPAQFVILKKKPSNMSSHVIIQQPLVTWRNNFYSCN